MGREIPQNEVKTTTVTVAASGLQSFFEELHKDTNVIKIEHEPSGANFKVTVHYALMDLALRMAVIGTRVETLAQEANEGTHLRTLVS